MAAKLLLGLSLLVAAAASPAQAAPAFDAAAAFGARPSVSDLSLSPDGKSVAFIAPTAGQGSILLTLSLEQGARPRPALRAAGKPDRLESCSWVANDRLVCTVYATKRDPVLGALPYTRLFAVNADGANLKVLSTQQDERSLAVQLFGGRVLDWMPDENGSVLMIRTYVPENHLGSLLGSDDLGIGVDRVDTRTLDISHVLQPNSTAVSYITDGRGTVRIMGSRELASGLDSGVLQYLYRTRNSQKWQPLSKYNYATREGFAPLAVDPDLDVVYGFKKKDGRQALYRVKLDGSLHEELVYSRPDVDLASVVRIGRRRHVVGVSYVTDAEHTVYLSADIRQLIDAISRALPGRSLRIADTNADESKMLIFAGSDSDPGVYYIFDRKERKLETFLVVRDELEGVKLASMRPILYPADDGAMVPGYLTLPPGHEDAKGLPGIVLPHGGTSSRDAWGFNWMSQYFANRGFAVLQPNFRGSAGYGDAWFEQNGFRSWRVAIGDIIAAGHWLVSQGVDPSKLGVVGRSYGGYAALQSAVVDPATFKAVVAIAPVTDLAALKEQRRHFNNYAVASDWIGSGPTMHEGSPIEHADKIKAPVLLFHGTLDSSVEYVQSERMAQRLKAAGDRCELVTFEGLDQSLEDSSARAEMLRKSDAFLRQAFGM